MTFERMVAMHALMRDDERAMFRFWEEMYLGGPDRTTISDWPGWNVIVKRLAS